VADWRSLAISCLRCDAILSDSYSCGTRRDHHDLQAHQKLLKCICDSQDCRSLFTLRSSYHVNCLRMLFVTRRSCHESRFNSCAIGQPAMGRPLHVKRHPRSWNRRRQRRPVPNIRSFLESFIDTSERHETPNATPNLPPTKRSTENPAGNGYSRFHCG
jgi:hypothetical protein